MPKEHRKRGKKHKKVADEGLNTEPIALEPQEAGPSWIHEAEDVNQQAAPSDAPFGYVDAELKAYFKNMEANIVEWNSVTEEVSSETIEERRTFLMALMSEIRGKELQLATDPDCALVLERVAYSMDDFVRRVFLDSLSGSYLALIKHRFGSHVCQTMFTLSVHTLQREAAGVLASAPNDGGDDSSVLRLMSQLILDAADELLPDVLVLLSDPFASHVLRALLQLLSAPAWANCRPQTQERTSLRSAKSAAYKARQGPMKSILDDPVPSGGPTVSAAAPVPPEFSLKAQQFLKTIRNGLNANETRALAIDPVASPLLQTLVKLEARLHEPELMDSILNRLLGSPGQLPSSSKQSALPRSEFVENLLRDKTASHLVEVILSESSISVFDNLWATHFTRSLADLATHPVANFVVAKAIERLNGEQLESAIEELDPLVEQLIRDARTGVIKALVERAASLHSAEKEVTESIVRAFGLDTPEDHLMLVPCCLSLKPFKIYRELEAKKANMATESPKPEEMTTRRHMYAGRQAHVADPLSPTVPGALILQSMLKLHDPQTNWVTDSIFSLPMITLIAISQNAISSRVLDAILESPTVPFKSRRKLITSFLGHFHLLVDDRIGSRIGDKLWETADPFLREKIAWSLVPHEATLHASHYGKYFMRHVNLGLLKRKPDEWKTSQVRKQTTVPAPNTASAENMEDATGIKGKDVKREKKRRREEQQPPKDEIDLLFELGTGPKAPAVKPSEEEDTAERRGDSLSKKKKRKKDERKLKAIETPNEILGSNTAVLHL